MRVSQFNFLQTASPPVRWAMGLITALAAFGITLLLPPGQRTPYLIAYPGVVLSAWIFGVGAGATCAIASGTIIELFTRFTHMAIAGPIPAGSPYRLIIFVLGSVMVTWFSQQVSKLRQRNATEELQRKLELAAVEQRLVEEGERARMALHERETRLQMALRGGQIGLG